ncbi:MAG TPA: NUDIX domain-containing protein [Chloroflexia bacterium]|nr:NUDIX domain-containing protein [Chloroflexia bacterium]
MTVEETPIPALQPTAVVAVDVVLFTVRAAASLDEAWQVLLVQTEDPAFAGKWALPGVLARAEETFDAAARRALRTKAGLDAASWYLEQLGTFGDPQRDTRGRVVSVAHVALERSDELTLAPGGGVRRAEWLPVRRVLHESLAFDHAAILRVGINRIQSKLRYSWVAFQLMPERFTLPELRGVYAAILDPSIARLNTSNFKKAFAALFASGALAPVGQRAEGGRPGRPGDLYAFTGPLAGTWERELPWHERGEAHGPA